MCKECRHSNKPPPAIPAHDIVKRALAADLKQSKQQVQGGTKQKSRRFPLSNEDDSTGDDGIGLSFSRESSTE